MSAHSDDDIEVEEEEEEERDVTYAKPVKSPHTPEQELNVAMLLRSWKINTNRQDVDDSSQRETEKEYCDKLQQRIKNVELSEKAKKSMDALPNDELKAKVAASSYKLTNNDQLRELAMESADIAMALYGPINLDGPLSECVMAILSSSLASMLRTKDAFSHRQMLRQIECLNSDDWKLLLSCRNELYALPIYDDVTTCEMLKTYLSRVTVIKADNYEIVVRDAKECFVPQVQSDMALCHLTRRLLLMQREKYPHGVLVRRYAHLNYLAVRRTLTTYVQSCQHIDPLPFDAVKDEDLLLQLTGAAAEAVSFDGFILEYRQQRHLSDEPSEEFLEWIKRDCHWKYIVALVLCESTKHDKLLSIAAALLRSSEWADRMLCTLERVAHTYGRFSTPLTAMEYQFICTLEEHVYKPSFFAVQFFVHVVTERMSMGTSYRAELNGNYIGLMYNNMIESKQVIAASLARPWLKRCSCATEYLLPVRLHLVMNYCRGCSVNFQELQWVVALWRSGQQRKLVAFDVQFAGGETDQMLVPTQSEQEQQQQSQPPLPEWPKKNTRKRSRQAMSQPTTSST